MLSIRRILFPTDFSEPAQYAWSYALTFAQEFGAEIHLLHVIAPPPRLTEAYAVDYDPEKMVGSLSAEANATMDRQIEAAKSRGLVFRREVQVGVDFREIIDYATKHNIDLIAMATHGRSGLAHVLLGSVAEKVVRKAPCPVLTIKHPSMRVQAP
jgi:nucleotide-binding universal stress UspA family protein